MFLYLKQGVSYCKIAKLILIIDFKRLGSFFIYSIVEAYLLIRYDNNLSSAAQ
jgi:hypothetical protein